MLCKKCNKDKNIEEFPFKNKSAGIRSCVCKECQREYKKNYYYRNKESHYERNKKTNEKIANFIDNYKKENPCIVCGESSLECLDFHHIEDKYLEVAKLRRMGSFKQVKEEILKCVVLCANCHRKVHAGTIKLGE